MAVWRLLRSAARQILPPGKAAIAAGLAWWLSELLFGGQKPYFAPLAAILTMQVTVSEAVSFGAQRVLGVIGGIGLSLAAAHFLRPGPFGVAVLVFIGMGTASAVGLANRAVAQVGISGLLVLALGSRPEYAAARMIETVLGAIVGVLVQAFIVPPDPIPAARDAVGALADEVARTLRRMAKPGGAQRTEEVSARAQAARDAVALARQSLAYSPLLRRRRGDAAHLHAALDALDAAADAVRGIAASLKSLGEDDEGTLPRPILEDAAQAVEALGNYVEHPDASRAARLAASGRRLQRGTAQSLRILSAPRRAEVRRELGAVLSEIERLRREIGKARRKLAPA